MAVDNVPPNPSTPPAPTSDHEVADSHLNSNVGKLDFVDSKLAGPPNSENCTLILTVGDYAKKIAMSSGLPIVGQDYYGVYPLKGKPLNVRDAHPEQVQKNTEIQNIKKILGLEDGKIYENVNELRYGHLLIMADRDHDGSRIIGLLINFLHYFWPSLLKFKNFMHMFIIPIGLATFEVKEGEEFFAKMDKHVKDFVWFNKDDDDAIKLAFSSEKREERKLWLLEEPQACTYFDSKDKSIRYLDFFNKQFKQYVVADLQRSIASMVDGLKPDQRKILFYAFKKPIIQEIEVAQFSAYVFDHSPYHHGEASLVGTIIGMAQNYVGSNNINLLQLNGRFGTRLMGGKDHDASGRYIFTQLSPITRYLFHKDKDDEPIPHYLNDDGQSIEPAWFIPIIPMVLVNGSEGRGTECSSFIPNYNPRDIIANLKRLLEGKAVVPMIPWYKGFKEEIQKETISKDTLYTTKGIIIEDKNAPTITITELPVGTSTQDYEEFLASRCGKDIKAYKAYTARNDNTNVHFEITMTEDQMNSAKQEGGFLNKFKLTTTLSTANMHLFGSKGELKKYDTPEQILEDFYHLRLELYEQRRRALIRELKIASWLLENKVKFIDKVRDGEILLFPLKEKDEWCAELKSKGFESLPAIARAVDHVEETEEEEPGTGYDYLLSTPAVSFTYEKMQELKQESDAMKKERDEITKSKSESLWLRDLNALDHQLDEEKYPLAERMAKIDFQSSQDVDESSPEIAEEASKNKKRRMW